MREPTPSNLPRRVFAVLLALLLVMVGLHLLTQWLMDRAAVEQIVRTDLPTYRLRFRLLNMDREMSLPAWVSSALLLFVGGLMGLAAWAQYVRGCGRRRRGVVGWAVLGLFFVALSLDESAAIHEVLVNRVQDILGTYATGLLFYAWYLPVLLAGAVLLLALMPFLLRLPRRTFWLLALGVGVYLLGAVGFEALMGMLVEPTGSDEPPLQHPGGGLVLVLLLEEGLELLGVSVLVYAMLDYLAPRLRLTVVPADGSATQQ